MLISEEPSLGKEVAAGCRSQWGWQQPPLHLLLQPQRVPGDKVALAGDPALQTVPSPSGGTGAMEGHWDRAGGLR